MIKELYHSNWSTSCTIHKSRAIKLTGHKFLHSLFRWSSLVTELWANQVWFKDTVKEFSQPITKKLLEWIFSKNMLRKYFEILIPYIDTNIYYCYKRICVRICITFSKWGMLQYNISFRVCECSWWFIRSGKYIIYISLLL